MGKTQDGRPTEPLSGDIPTAEGSIVHRATLPSREGAYRDPSTVLPADLADPFRRAYGQLFAHQASALEALAAGENVIVTTETASGKTFTYALEIARRRYRDPDTTALLVFPTKALARDQERELNDLYTALGLDLTVRVYDGDTPTERRRRIRETADVVITNFVGLNVYLPHHRRWGALFGDCEVVAIDEAHAYTGVFGMNVAWTVRRLRRVLAHHGADPSFVCTSATIGNPGEHARRLTGEPVTVVDEDGSPRGRRDIAFWRPPAGQDEVAPDASFAERSAAGSNPVREAAGILAHLGLGGQQTLMFSRSRKSAELGAKYARRAARAHPNDGELAVEPYHAGLGKETRRGTEHQLTAGTLDGVSSTNALELGIDIGSMDATVLTGYPGTRQSFWQQVGRSGRGERDARSVFVAGDDAIDQYLLDDPEYVLEGPVEDAVIGLENNPVYAQHVLAAANELPLTEDDRPYFDGDRLARAVEMWRKAGRLEGDLVRGVRYTGSPRPEADISMYGAGGQEFAVVCENGDIDMEPVARERAYRDHHEGALFLHDGVQYEVTELVEDVSHPYLTVRAVDVDAYTETHSEKRIRDLEPEETRDLGEGYRLAWGMGTVEIDYTTYQRRAIGSGRALTGPRPTGVPPIELRTHLVWIELPAGLEDAVVSEVTGASPGTLSEAEVTEVFGGGLHGAEHGMIKLAPLELRMDAGDLGGLSTPRHHETGTPAWFIHDAVDGGLGFGEQLYGRFGSLGRRTRARVAACECEGTNGCPGCIMDAQCGNKNRPLHTAATVAILDRVLERL